MMHLYIMLHFWLVLTCFSCICFRVHTLLSCIGEVNEVTCPFCLEPLLNNSDDEDDGDDDKEKQDANKEDHEETILGFLSTCHHIFHFECFWEWVAFKKLCPTCRTPASAADGHIRTVHGSVLLRLATGSTEHLHKPNVPLLDSNANVLWDISPKTRQTSV